MTDRLWLTDDFIGWQEHHGYGYLGMTESIYGQSNLSPLQGIVCPKPFPGNQESITWEPGKSIGFLKKKCSYRT
ncbi:hypothetical protein SELR_pSRC300400 (plasmid) [Selenomonas ruminantium subsp. lactilytica TAM6421]|uniref:Uncharacterized protein n=1 Tax=Selenomonas ruminantium subsp. lactilytica (strain NBRC 103574 / TAM6421) TaxID=927704 RepID=I0GWH6_SELRL|nr:hypothetical protein SELR_pSRC300400 [Selenomonas ruminantium subsp. lactilytica TAM6421]